jgi:hypothetical protein
MVQLQRYYFLFKRWKPVMPDVIVGMTFRIWVEISLAKLMRGAFKIHVGVAMISYFALLEH